MWYADGVSHHRPSSVWEYMAVAYRSSRDPYDAVSWLRYQMTVFLPHVLWREVRSPWWSRRPLWLRLLWVAGALLNTGGAVSLAAVFIPLFAAPERLMSRLVPAAVSLGAIGLTWLLSLAVLAGIALRLPDRDLLPLRRVRTVGARPWEPDAGAEMLRRRAFWSETLRRWRSGALERRHWSVDPRPVLLQTLLGLLLVGTLMLCAVMKPPIGVFLAVAGLVSIVEAVGIKRCRGFLRDRIAGAVECRACPDCGYSLEGAADRPTDAAALAAWPGPRRCPECGAPWPLIPPPAPRLVNARGEEVSTAFGRAMRAVGAGFRAAFMPRHDRLR